MENPLNELVEALDGEEEVVSSEESEGVEGESLQEPDGEGNEEEPVDKAENEDEAEAQEPDAEDEDSDLIEWGEGENLKQKSLQELIEFYENPEVDFDQAPQVQERLAEVQQKETQYHQALEYVAKDYSQMQQRLEQAIMTSPQPQMPDMGLMEQNPGEYNRQLARYHNLNNEQQQRLKAYEETRQKHEAAQAEVERNNAQREVSLLKKAWPEIANDKAVSESMYNLLTTQYGVSREDIDSVDNHRFFLMAKDLLDYHQGKKAGEKATATLKSKSAPRRVKGRKSGGVKMSALDTLNQKSASGAKVTEAEATAALLAAI
ncbi:hypothetical protein [Litorimonas sp.]|uniref:hypothetical protein n=1 Tax=Litorimonas sp. TaxID=1892381 RepID=UPI003A8AFF4F